MKLSLVLDDDPMLDSLRFNIVENYYRNSGVCDISYEALYNPSGTLILDRPIHTPYEGTLDQMLISIHSGDGSGDP